jgi:hypothetical protein
MRHVAHEQSYKDSFLYVYINSVGGDEDMLRDYPFPLSLLSKVLQCMMDLHNPHWGQPLCTLDPVHAGRIGTFGPLLIQRDLYRLARTERWAGSLFSGDRASGMYGPSSRPDLRPRAEILAVHRPLNVVCC